MHIKQLTIQGFKSYRDQTTSEPFHPGHNVIVGRNGSGKSNFFAAIRFVLADAYTSLSAQERSALLHDGPGASTMSAFVELVIDNSDGRFPTGRDTLVLRRTVGLKKDEYSLDRKSVGKADVVNLLEAAGFSRANPFYIVPQGRITHLTNAKDIERLNLLKDVAGTKVYETRRAESMNIMQETETRQAKIDELLEFIRERLSSLEEEMEELRRYQALDKEKRCLDYCIQEHQSEEVAKVLAEVEEEYERELESFTKVREERDQTTNTLAELETSLVSVHAQIQALQMQAAQLENERRDLAAELGRATARIADLEVDEARQDDTRAELTQQLQSLETSLAEKELELAPLLPQLEDARTKEAQIVQALQLAQAELQALLQKAGRGEQFRSRAQRDAFLKSEIKQLERQIQIDRREIEASKTEIEALSTEEKNVAKDIEEVVAIIGDRREAQARTTEQLALLRRQLSDSLETKKALWRQEAQTEASASQAKEAVRKARLTLAGTLDQQTVNGIESIERIQERLNLPGYYGPLYTLFTVDSRYKTCAEVVAGSSIFDIVVDNDDTASVLLNAMKAEKGRVTFVPLSRIATNRVDIPQASDAIPLIKRVTYDPTHVKAIEQVFGRAYVCPNMQVAGSYASRYGVTAITLDGDKVDRKGTMSGGFYDKRRSRLDAVVSINDWNAQLAEANGSLRRLKADIVVAEQKGTEIAGQIQKMELQLLKFGKFSSDDFSGRYDSLVARRRELQSSLRDTEEQRIQLETKLARAQFEKEALQTELETPMRELTDIECSRLHDLKASIDLLTAQREKAAEARTVLQSQLATLDIEINDDLQKRIANTKHKIKETTVQGTGSSTETAAEHRQTAARAQLALENLQEELKQLEQETDSQIALRATLQSRIEEIKSKEQESVRGVEAQQQASERFLARKQHLLRRQEECQSAIRDLGVLPEEAYEKYDPAVFNASKVFKRLKKVSEQLRKYSHVNKKAFDQHSSFTRQREQLIERRDELSGSSASIMDLIHNLDQQKDEAIARTFSQVAKNFADIFERLVPFGKGQLIIQRRMDENDDLQATPLENSQYTQDIGGNYTGVAIKVSFNSKNDEGLQIQQLSGGQKSLCALALIFAIQRCDPAPFYLFDEIDANLDAQYRTAVADMIHELSSSAQFITTTFRPEMLQRADKYYGVLFQNKVSSLHCIDAERALEFVELERPA